MDAEESRGLDKLGREIMREDKEGGRSVIVIASPRRRERPGESENNG